MKSMCKHWGLHISTNINCLEVVLGSFWAVWRGLLLSLEPELRSWRFPRYWWFNKWYHGGYQLICLISWPLLIASRRDWYRSKGLLRALSWLWDHGNRQRISRDMKFVTAAYSITKGPLCFVCYCKPNQGQEDFNYCCCCPDNSFLYENIYASQQR